MDRGAPYPLDVDWRFETTPTQDYEKSLLVSRTGDEQQMDQRRAELDSQLAAHINGYNVPF